jgi:hypothetical protein
MTFVDFKKLLLDADITLPKFAKLIKVSDKNIQSYKNKDAVPNAIAALAKSYAVMQEAGIDYRTHIKSLNLESKKKEGSGFSSKAKIIDS